MMSVTCFMLESDILRMVFLFILALHFDFTKNLSSEVPVLTL